MVGSDPGSMLVGTGLTPERVGRFSHSAPDTGDLEETGIPIAMEVVKVVFKRIQE